MCEDYFFFFFSLIYDGLSKFIQLLDIIISVTELFESYFIPLWNPPSKCVNHLMVLLQNGYLNDAEGSSKGYYLKGIF